MARETIEGWRGQKIVGARSRKSGVFAARDWRDLVLDAEGDIEKKARSASRQISAFEEEDKRVLTEVDGRYSDVQSLNSEDTVTWAAFGKRERAPDAALDRLLKRVFRCSPPATEWERKLWPRSAHPDTGVESHGPEPDLVLRSEGWSFVVEAKWTQDLDRKQGQNGSTGQLEMRLHVARKEGEPDRRGVLVVVPSPARYPKRSGSTDFARHFSVDGDGYRPTEACEELASRFDVPVAATTWEAVVKDLAEAKADPELIAYLNWRLGHLG